MPPGDQVPKPIENLNYVADTPDFRVATLENYVILVWRKQVIAPGANATWHAFNKLRRETDKKIGFLTLAEENAQLQTSPEVRQVISRILKDNDSHLGAAAVVFTGKGFRATFARSVVTAINIASTSSFPNRVFDNQPEALEWLTQKMQPYSKISEALLTQALQHIRA